MKITLIGGGKKVVAGCKEGETLLAVLRQNGFPVAADCGGRGICGRCRVRVFGGSFGEGKIVLACETPAEDGIAVESEFGGGGLTEGLSARYPTDKEEGFGVAVDIGTTTVAFSLLQLSTGKTLEKYAELNRQAAFGADVISRIMAAEGGGAALLAETVRSQIEGALARFRQKYTVGIDKVAVCGNTTMLHLFCGEDVSGIGRYPFTPAFTEYRERAGEEYGLSCGKVQVLPSVSAYVGADVVAGCIAAGLNEREGMLADIGTNGEMLAHASGKFFCTSTAAGPCFEGANIECGMGGVAGAVDSLRFAEGKLSYTTIGGAAPCGICGAGLVDAVALMLEKGVIDETGAFVRGDKFYIADGVYVSQKDVRNFQLAKSAVCSGIRVLAARAGLALSSLELDIAGGLGFYLDGKSAEKTGLFPKENSLRRAVGNAALAGTEACMLSKAALAKAIELAENTQYIDLSADADFMDEYIGNMNF